MFRWTCALTAREPALSVNSATRGIVAHHMHPLPSLTRTPAEASVTGPLSLGRGRARCRASPPWLALTAAASPM
jgi:hypothetical protein